MLPKQIHWQCQLPTGVQWRIAWEKLPNDIGTGLYSHKTTAKKVPVDRGQKLALVLAVMNISHITRASMPTGNVHVPLAHTLTMVTHRLFLSADKSSQDDTPTTCTHTAV